MKESSEAIENKENVSPTTKAKRDLLIDIVTRNEFLHEEMIDEGEHEERFATTNVFCDGKSIEKDFTTISASDPTKHGQPCQSCTGGEDELKSIIPRAEFTQPKQSEEATDLKEESSALLTQNRVRFQEWPASDKNNREESDQPSCNFGSDFNDSIFVRDKDLKAIEEEIVEMSKQRRDFDQCSNFEFADDDSSKQFNDSMAQVSQHVFTTTRKK